MENLTWKSGDATLAIAISTAVVCFSLYWFVAHSAGLKKLVETRNGDGYFHLYGAFYQKMIGIICLGIIPVVVSLLFLPNSLMDYGVGVGALEPSLYWILLFGGGLSFIPWYSARQEKMHSFYPQVRVVAWSRRLLIINGLVWVFYLFAYEFLFRGFLLQNTASVLGWWPAIVITTAISAITHIPKGSKETFGTIPLSIILCLIVVQTGAIWACVAVHAILAISNDYWALFYHPQMRLKKEQALEKNLKPETLNPKP